MPALSASGHAARALAANVACTYPSFCDEIVNGNATTLWETFDGKMSRNHIMFGTQSAWYFGSLAGIGKGSYTSVGARAGVGGGSFLGSGWRRLILRPQLSCEFLSPRLNLSSVDGELALALGTVRSSWRLHSCPHIPTPAPRMCSVVLEKDKYQTNTTGVMHLDCGPGKVVDAVRFADFGTPEGSCAGGDLRVNTSCTSAATTKARVEALCLGKQECRIEADVKIFGDPCLRVPKRLAVLVDCQPHSTQQPHPQAPLPIGPVALDWNISVPVGSVAAAHAPLLGAPVTAVQISVDVGSKRQLVWTKGAFVSAPGLLSGRFQGGAVVFECVSGSYAFEIRGAGGLR